MRIRRSRLHPFCRLHRRIFYVFSKFESSSMLLFEVLPYVCIRMYVHIIAIDWSSTIFLWPRPVSLRPWSSVWLHVLFQGSSLSLSHNSLSESERSISTVSGSLSLPLVLALALALARSLPASLAIYFSWSLQKMAAGVCAVVGRL